MTNYDVGIIGAGVAGAFAALKISKDYKGIKTILFDLGRPPMKRRRQLEGWLGCLPNSDGKLYQTDADKVSNLVGTKKIKSAKTFFNKALSDINDFDIIQDKGPSISATKRVKKAGFNLILNDFIQLYPKDIHLLSKLMSEFIEDNGDMSFSFDNEVRRIYKQKNMFVITTDEQEYRCKKIIFAVGRSGWRWANEVYSNFGIIESNDFARFGIRVEVNSPNLKDFNKSNCTILKGDDLEIGPLSWFGTVIPEDHVDLAISAFRSNENRWKTDKVSFQLIKNISYPENGFQQTDRVGKLTFVLSNDRIIKEKVSTILTDKSKISIIPEYDWLKESLEQLETIMPEISNKAYFHVPTITPMAPKIILGDNLESEIEGMFVAGESAGITGIMAAAITGIIAAESACK
jgi:uncharacterized FAD-dependent dehydrogenase